MWIVDACGAEDCGAVDEMSFGRPMRVWRLRYGEVSRAEWSVSLALAADLGEE